MFSKRAFCEGGRQPSAPIANNKAASPHSSASQPPDRPRHRSAAQTLWSTSKMQISREAALALVLLSCIAGGAAGTLEDGLPRPRHFAHAPTTSYGPDPELRNATMAVADCAWYGFGNTLYANAQVMWCLNGMRAAITNATENPPSSLRPFRYYTLSRMIDPANNESYCYQGCFKLDASSTASSPGLAPAPYVRGPSFAPLYSPAKAPVVAGSPDSSPAVTPAPTSGL